MTMKKQPNQLISNLVKVQSTDYEVKILWDQVALHVFVHSVILWELIYLFIYPEQIRNCLKLLAFGFFYATFVTAVGIGAGAHRLWSHRSYKAKGPLRVFLALAFVSAGQRNLITWVRDHRVHHKYSETDADPHNASRGFLFAHQGWLMVKRHPENVEKSSTIDMDDVLNDPVVIWSTRYYWILVVITLIVIPTLIPYIWFKAPLVHCLLMTGVRFVISLHGTWAVNSAAHLWGDRPYDDTIGPTECHWFKGLIPIGEFYHNYHHTFPQDYRASELGWLGQWNINAAFIDLMAVIGQAYDLKVIPQNVVESRKSRTGQIKSS